MRSIFENHISKKAVIKTDKLKGYIPITKDYNITQQLSKNGNHWLKVPKDLQKLKTCIKKK